MRIFAWRVATKTLPTKENKWKRTLELDNTCSICGREAEDEFHATVSCTKARTLREGIRVHWALPDEDKFQFTGVDWLQNLLGKCDNETRRRILLMMWRAWWLRDDCIHADGKALIGQSVCFLVKYVEETRLGGDECVEHSEGGRWANHQENDPVNQRRMEIREGKKPQGALGRSMIERGALHTRQSTPLILGQKQYRMHACTDPEQAELAAVLHGLLVLSKYYTGPVNMESNCASIVLLLNIKGTNQSCHFPLIADAEHIKKEFKEVTFRFINRSSNKLAHELAALATGHGDYFKLGDVPPSLRNILREDCNCPRLNL
ncbi:hypothetical protein ZWY2020_030638 [Hordeum vulgare]|nr:hypothetical protein ZWY2020_030638 [Hordeum vulgare]